MLLKVLLVVCAVLVAAVAFVFWPASKGGNGFPPPLTLEQAQALPDDKLVQQLVMDLSHRMYVKGYAPAAWKALPDAARNLWVTSTGEPKILDRGLLFFLITYEAGSAGLLDMRDAYSALGADGLYEALDHALTTEGARGQEAADRCIDFQRSSNAPPFVRPPGFVDPFTANDSELRAAFAKPGIRQVRLAYAKAHLAEIVLKQ